MVTPMPVQPIKDGRFIPNRIVEKLLETSTLDLNDIARMEFTNQERMQLAQLIGYSVGGFGTLSYVDDETYDTVSLLENNQKQDHLRVRYTALNDKLSGVKKELAKVAALVFEKHEDDFL